MNEDTIKSIELNIVQAKKIEEVGNALERLKANKDFKRVVIEGYFEQEAVRLVHLKSDPSFQTEQLQQSIISQIDAIGNLSQYFQTLRHKASLANKAIEADEETRDELLAEELNND